MRPRIIRNLVQKVKWLSNSEARLSPSRALRHISIMVECLAIVVLTMGIDSFLREIIGTCTVVMLIGTIVTERRDVRLCAYLSCALWIVVLFAPYDLAVRSSGRFSCRVVPVVYTACSHSRNEIEQAISSGLRENVEFLDYGGHSCLFRVRHALLISVPSSCQIRTPLLGSVRTGTKRERTH